MSKLSSRQSDIIDIPGLLQLYASKWYWFVASVIGCVLIAFVIARATQPRYAVRANIVITDEEQQQSLSEQMGAMSALFGAKAEAEDEVFIVGSHSVLREVAKALDINRTHIDSPVFMMKYFRYRDYRVDVVGDSGVADTLRTTLTFKIKVNDKGLADIKVKGGGETLAKVKKAALPTVVETPYGKFTVRATKYYEPGTSLKTTVKFSGYDDAAESLSELISVGLGNKKSNVIGLEMEHTDVEYAKDVLNEVITQYNNRGVSEKNSKNEKTAEFIEQRLGLLTRDLADTEHDIEDYKRQQGVIDIEVDAQQSLAFKNLVEPKLITAESSFEILRMVRDFVSRPENAYQLIPMLSFGSGVDVSGGGGSSESSQSLQEPVTIYNNLLLQRMRMEQNARPDNAAIRALTEQIDAMRENIIASLNKAYESAEIQLNDVRRIYHKNEGRLGDLPTQERYLRDAMRQQAVKEEIYVFLLQKQEETAIALANSIPKGQIIDEAYSLNEPLNMKRRTILLVAFFIGMLLTPMALYVKKMLRTKFANKEEVEELVSVPVLGEMCSDRTGESLVVRPGGSTSTAELFRLIRTNLQFVLGGTSEKVILLTSTMSGEGKSFISINLAASLALLGKKTLLIGMDIRKPRLMQYLNLKPSRGLTEYLSSDSIALPDIIQHDAVAENLDLIVAGPVPPNPSELLASQKLDDMIQELRPLYDYIIIDSAPVGMVSDSFLLARVSDATVYVCRANYTTIKDLRFVESIYQDNRLKKMSLVVNGTNTRKGYGYGYGEDHGKKGSGHHHHHSSK